MQLEQVAYLFGMIDEQKSERVHLMMTPSELEAVDEWSFDSRIRGRSEAIRRLIELGLEVAKASPSSQSAVKG